MTDEGLAARVFLRLEDERAIVRTLFAYGHGLDYGPEEAFIDVFTEDARWIRVPGKLPERRFEGRNGLIQMFQHHLHAPDVAHKHVVVNPVVDADGDHAQARSYLLFVNEHPEGPYVRAFSRCRDEFVRCADGKWRIAERRAELEAWSPRDFPPAPWVDLPLIVS